MTTTRRQFLLGLVAYSLAEGVYPALVKEEQNRSVYWGFAFLTAFLFLVTIVLHELSHSLVATRM